LSQNSEFVLIRENHPNFSSHQKTLTLLRYCCNLVDLNIVIGLGLLKTSVYSAAFKYLNLKNYSANLIRIAKCIQRSAT